jgi:electron transfer flavoprotein beta subunit
MKILVPVKQVPDLVEELEIDSSGKSLDKDILKFTLNEFDAHALEEALLLKEEKGAEVAVMTLDVADADNILFTAAAKGADTIVKICGSFEYGVSSHSTAKAYADAAKSLGFDLILTGVQAADDRDGQVGGLIAAYLGLPYVSVVTGVRIDGSTAIIHKEYAGGMMAELEVALPAVLGIQAARQAPRYAPISKVRQAMKTAKIETVEAGDIAVANGSFIKRMAKPESGSRAEMLEGSPDEVARKIVELIGGKGLL